MTRIWLPTIHNRKVQFGRLWISGVGMIMRNWERLGTWGWRGGGDRGGRGCLKIQLFLADIING